MSQYTSYYLYQKYEKRGEQAWQPVYPDVFSIDGNGTMPLSAKTVDDPECGYTPQETPIYRWVTMDISTDWICDENCCSAATRWVQSSESDYVCSGTSKCYKEYEQESMDCEQTWQSTGNWRIGSLISSGSSDCGFFKRTVSTAFTCVVYDKHYLDENQVSYDYGATWITTSTTTGDLVEADSTYCGYVPPTPVIERKWEVTYGDGSVISAECDSISAITDGEIPWWYKYTDNYPVELIVGDCVSDLDLDGWHKDFMEKITLGNGITKIEYLQFSQCSKLSSFTMSNNVTLIDGDSFSYCGALTGITFSRNLKTIEGGAFKNCSGFTSITIPNSVTSIGYQTFYNCSGLNSIIVNSSTPPTLGGATFDNTNNCPIYVPAESVEAYKTATYWSNYASRITAITS